MKIEKKPLLVVILFLFILIPVVYAATSSDFLTKGQKSIISNCSKRNLSNETSLSCYLYYKVGELDSRINSNSSRISALENEPTTTPLPTSIPAQNINEITIFPQGNLQNESYSNIQNLSNHKMLILNCLWSNGTGGIWVYYSNNQTDWNLDYRAGCGGNSNDDYKQVFSTIKGDYYKFKVINSFSGEIKAILY